MGPRGKNDLSGIGINPARTQYVGPRRPNAHLANLLLEGPSRLRRGSCLLFLALKMQLRDLPSDRDLRQQRHEPFSFRGYVEDDPDGMYPTLGWTLVWKGTYSNIFGHFISNQVRRHWGYIMWDTSRYGHMGAEEDLLPRNASAIYKSLGIQEFFYP